MLNHPLDRIRIHLENVPLKWYTATFHWLYGAWYASFARRIYLNALFIGHLYTETFYCLLVTLQVTDGYVAFHCLTCLIHAFEIVSLKFNSLYIAFVGGFSPTGVSHGCYAGYTPLTQVSCFCRWLMAGIENPTPSLCGTPIGVNFAAFLYFANLVRSSNI